MSRAYRFYALLLLMVLTSVFVFGQAETGQLTGTVSDSSGAVVPGATVTTKSVNTGATRTMQTTGAGSYSITNLQPDTYEVSVEGKGFQKLTSRVVVNVGSRAEFSPRLTIGGSSTTVEVAAEGGGAVVNTESQTLSQVVTSRELDRFPTLTRNAYDLVATAGNVGDTEKQGANGDSSRGAGFNINGQRSANTD